MPDFKVNVEGQGILEQKQFGTRSLWTNIGRLEIPHFGVWNTY